MTYELVIRSCAEKDISDAVYWYEDKVKGLGERFLLSIDATFSSIQRNPRLYPVVYKKFRRALLKRFPYSLYYIVENNTITIIAVLHQKQKHDNWKFRI